MLIKEERKTPELQDPGVSGGEKLTLKLGTDLLVFMVPEKVVPKRLTG